MAHKYTGMEYRNQSLAALAPLVEGSIPPAGKARLVRYYIAFHRLRNRYFVFMNGVPE